jgi:hypothetical protein
MPYGDKISRHDWIGLTFGLLLVIGILVLVAVQIVEAVNR